MFLRSKTPANLKGSELASKLPAAELQRLDELGTAVDVEAGEEIIARSSRGRQCFVVVDGELVVQGEGFTGRIGAGEVAGELALLTGRPRSASVKAAGDAKVYALRPADFATLLSDAPKFRRSVLDDASDRLGKPVKTIPAQFLPAHAHSS